MKSVVQADSMDNDLRNSLWNALDLIYWRHVPELLEQGSEWSQFFRYMWLEFFKEPLDTLEEETSDVIKRVRLYFFNQSMWSDIYDFIEFVAQSPYVNDKNKPFTDLCNLFLQREISAYRFLGTTLTKVTDQEEIAEIDNAIQTPIDSVKKHLQTALTFMSDRKNPDYRNSVKESISAVESLARIICNDEKATLGEAIKLIEKQGKISWHPSFKESLNKLYGYTSDKGGIRHGLGDSDDLDFEEAKFMLVTSSAFVNYLAVEANKVGISLA